MDKSPNTKVDILAKIITFLSLSFLLDKGVNTSFTAEIPIIFKSESAVDIMADNKPAINTPFKPTGRIWSTRYGKARLGLILESIDREIRPIPVTNIKNGIRMLALQIIL